MKLYFSPSTQEKNSCRVGDSEEQHMNSIANLMEPLLKHNGFDYVRNTPDMTHISSKDASNQGTYDLHYALHSNAFSGKETYCVIYYVSLKGKRYAEILAKHYRKIYPWTVKVEKAARKYTELYKTKAPSVIDEISFHDNPVTAQWIHDNMERIAKNKVQALCECFGIEYSEPMNYGQALDILSNKVGIDKAYWLTRGNIDPYFDELMIKIAKYLKKGE